MILSTCLSVSVFVVVKAAISYLLSTRCCRWHACLHSSVLSSHYLRWGHRQLMSIWWDKLDVLYLAIKRRPLYSRYVLYRGSSYVAVLAADDWADITVVWHCVYRTSGTLNTCEHIVLSAPTNDVDIMACYIAIFIKERYWCTRVALRNNYLSILISCVCVCLYWWLHESSLRIILLLLLFKYTYPHTGVASLKLLKLNIYSLLPPYIFSYFFRPIWILYMFIQVEYKNWPAEKSLIRSCFD